MTMVKSMIAKKGCVLSLRASLSVFIFTLFLFSCQRPDAIKVPEGTMSESKMVEILTDIHLVEGAKVGNKIMGDTIPAPVYFKKVYQKYNISEEQFAKDFAFYTANPKLMDDIYEKVIENLNKIETTPPREVMTDDITREQMTSPKPIKDIAKKVKEQKADSSKTQDE